MSQRSPVQITTAVWKALLLREATFRLFGTRAAWAWLLLEPMLHFAFLSFLLTVIRQRVIGGLDTVIWLIIGLIGFFFFRRTTSQMAGAIDSNRALYTYRQVLPFDTIMVRGILEAFIMVIAVVVVAIILALLGYEVVPDRPLMVLASLIGLWLLGMGLGLFVAAANEFASEARNVLGIVMLPLYFISGVIFPVALIPGNFRWILTYNPIFHGVDGARAGFSDFYHAAPELSLGYLYFCALILILAGLVLYRRIENPMGER